MSVLRSRNSTLKHVHYWNFMENTQGNVVGDSIAYKFIPLGSVLEETS